MKKKTCGVVKRINFYGNKKKEDKGLGGGDKK